MATSPATRHHERESSDMATALKDVRIHLSDPSLLREQNYIDGAWVDADRRATIEGRDPASNEVIGTVPKMGVDETRRSRSRAARPPTAPRSSSGTPRRPTGCTATSPRPAPTAAG